MSVALATTGHNTLPAELDALYLHLQSKMRSSVGYPCNQNFDYQPLHRFLEFSLNNLGDPFAESNYKINTQAIEREVIQTFAELMHAPVAETWGYVTNGGTEGNMYGLYLARELFPRGIVYFSEDTHYSVVKILHVLGVRSIMIKSQPNGEMDYEDLKETIRLYRDVPPIIFANIGTTMKGAVDNVTIITGILKSMAISQYYLHCDAALSGMILPFVDQPQPYDFAAGADSISVSGHKMVGSPIPCGIVLAKKNYVNRIGRSIEYVGALDTTIPGSRNGFTPLLLWYAWRTHGVEGFRAIIKECIAMADYAIARMKDAGISAWRHENSVTVVFPRPVAEVMQKWQIAPYKDIGHIITMPHVTRDIVDELVHDMQTMGKGA